MIRRLAVLVAGLALVATAAAPAQALDPQSPREISSEAPFIADGLYQVKYTQELWEVDNEGNTARAISFEEWDDAGRPAYKTAPTDYVRYAWSSRLYAVTFFGKDSSTWLWDPVEFSQWQTAGFPPPRTAGFIKGSLFFQYQGSPEIFVDEDGGDNDGIANDQPAHKLTLAEWQAAGSPQPEQIPVGFYKLTWDTSGMILGGSTGDVEESFGAKLTFEFWRQLGFPTPQRVLHLPGDEPPHFGVHRRENPNDKTLVYRSEYFGYTKILTYGEWIAMGAPAPGEPTQCTEANVNCDSDPIELYQVESAQ